MKKVIRKIAGIFAAAAVAFSAVTLPDMGFLPGLTAPASAEEPTEISSFWELIDAFNNGGNYKLTKNITINSFLSVVHGKVVTLDLNGFTLGRTLGSATNDGCVIKVDGTLTVKDGSQGKTGKITGGKNTYEGGGIFVRTAGHFTLESGTISGNETALKGGGVYIIGSEASFIMNGGTISGNTANRSSSLGGGVYNNRGTFIMNGGTISGNTAGSFGGGVYNNLGTFTMTGGSIQGNTAKDWGGGVYNNQGTFNISGCPVIADNKLSDDTVSNVENAAPTVTGALDDGASICVKGRSGATVAVAGENYTLTESDAAKFHSDNDSLVVGLDKTINKMYFGYPITVSDSIENGTVTADKTVAVTNDTVTLTVTPAEGCKVGTVTYNDGSDHTITPVDGVYSFTMPAGGVTVGATFIEPTAVLDEETGVLTLQGNVIANEVRAYQGYAGINSPVTAVVCKSGTVLPKDCSYLFSSFDQATVIDLSNAYISDFTNMINMTNMTGMFEGCSKLTTIYVSSDWRKPSENYSRNMFYHCGNLLGGNGTRFANEDFYIGAEVAGSGTYAVIDGKGGEKGYLSVKPVISEASVTLKDDLGLNFIVGDANEYNYRNLSIKLTGNCAENGQTLPLTKKTIDGRSVYCVTANITASHMGDTITAQLYNGTLLLSTKECSVYGYLDAAGKETSDSKLLNMIEKTSQYGAVSYAYFNTPDDMPTVTSHKDDLPAQTYAPTFKNGAEDKLSLGLFSKLTVRLYISGLEPGQTAKYGSETLIAASDSYGAYFDIINILPTAMASDFTITYAGSNYTFKPLSWAYRILTSDNPTARNVAMANALYEYYMAANAYTG